MVDLAALEGRDIAMGLVDGAGVVLESWRPGVADRLGLGYTDLRRIAHAWCTARSRVPAPRARMPTGPGTSRYIAAHTGLMADRLPPGAPPVYPGVPLAGMGAGLLAVIGIGATLVARNRPGGADWWRRRCSTACLRS